MTHSLLNQTKKIILSSNRSRFFSSLKNSRKPDKDSNLKIVPNQTHLILKRFNQTAVCWKCGWEQTNSAQLFCEKCSFIQNPQEKKNYFKVMDVEEKFNIDQKSLHEKYRRLQSQLHPDKFSNKSLQEKEISEEFSSLVNKAYNNLQIPMKRAEHLLKLKGAQVSEDETVDEPQFLMEIMELNEEVESAKNDEQALRKLNLKNKSELDSVAKEIDSCFVNNDIEKAKKLIVKMKYFTSLSHRINSIMRELGIVD